MINPNRVHSARAVVSEIPKGLYQTYKVKLERTGAVVEGYDLPARFKLGDKVSIRAQFFITADKYMVIKNGIRKARS